MAKKLKISFINCILDTTIFHNTRVEKNRGDNQDTFTPAWFLNASLLHFKTYYELYSPEFAENVEWHQVLPTQDYVNTYVDQIVKNNSDWLFVGMYIWTQPGLAKIVREVKKKLPNLKVMVGGPEVEHKDYTWLKERSWITYACYGDGYKFVKYILDCHFTNKKPDINETENALWIEGDKIVKAPHAIFKDKKFYNIPLWWHNRKIVRKWFAWAKERGIQIIVNYEASRGCPYHCAFCDWTSGLHNKVTFWGLMPIYKDLAFFGQEDIRYLKLCDANFGQMERDVDITRFWALVRRKYPKVICPWEITWSKLQKDRVYKIFDMMLDEKFDGDPENENLITWTLSFQDVDKTVLDAIDRPEIPWEKHKDYIHNLQAKYPDLQLVTELISGMPHQTPQSMLDTQYEVLSCNVRTRWYLWMYLPNSPVGNKEYRDKIGVKILNLKTPGGILYRPPTEDDLEDFPICISYIKGMQTAIDNFKVASWLKQFYSGYHTSMLTDFLDLALSWFQIPGANDIWQIVAKKCEDIITGKTQHAYFYTSVYTVDMWNFMKRTMFVDLGAVPAEGLYAGETYEQKRDRLLELILQPITLPGLVEEKKEYAVLDQF
jgi:hypothetical protein